MRGGEIVSGGGEARGAPPPRDAQPTPPPRPLLGTGAPVTVTPNSVLESGVKWCKAATGPPSVGGGWVSLAVGWMSLGLNGTCLT